MKNLETLIQDLCPDGVEFRTMEEVFEIRNGYTPSKNNPDFWEGGTIPWFRMEDIRQNGRILSDAIQHITPAAIKGKGLFPANSIIIATTATIGEHALVIADSLANQRFTNFRVRKSLTDNYISNYIYYSFFGIDEWSKRNINSGGLLSVNIPSLIKQPFYTPRKEEQQTIASYFTSLDAQISASISHLASLKQIKAASLQAMFPQEGETMPKIRFKGFEGEWESLDLCESFELLKNNTLSRAELTDEGKIANIHYGDILIKYGECIDTAVDKLTYIIDNEVGKNLLKNGALKKGDIIFADTAEDNTVGKCSELICRDNEVIVAGLHTIACRPQIDIAERYLGYYLNSPAYHNQLLPHIQGTKVSSISRKAINTTKVVIPKEKEEQQAIASFFTSLDRQISLYAKRLEKLKHIKAACLEKMFV